jgi:hypothetical protein
MTVTPFAERANVTPVASRGFLRAERVRQSVGF